MAARAAPGALKAGVRNLSTPRTLNPQAGVIKMKGGNWLGGSIEKALEDLKRPDRMTGGRKDPSESLAEMKARYTPEAIAEMPPELRGTVIAGFQDLEKKVALNNWVDSNLYGYIKNDMATPQDPVRLMIERRMAEIDQKFAKDMERANRIKQRAEAEPDPRRKANFERQAQTSMAEAEAERDTAMKYASHMPQNEIDYANQWIPEDLALSRMRAGFPTEGLGQSNTAKGWEAITDSYIHTAPAGNYTKPLTESEVRRSLTSVVGENPWLSKLDPDTPVQYLKNADSISQDLRLDHIMDVLREDVASGRIRPEQLSKVSMEQAVRRTAEYDQELAAKMSAARAAQREGLPVYKDYPEGYKWVQLNRPGDFAAESEAMGHSVRGYEPPQGHPDWVEGSGDRGSLGYGVGGWDAIKSGKAKVYSLVDAKGDPHVTVEVESGRPWNERSGIFYDNPELEPSWQRFSQEASLEEKARGLDRPSNYIERYPEWLKANDPEMYAKHANVFEESPPLVRQIKGKGNERPVERYDPFTQDFVKSGNWSDVRDLENTGLIEAGGKYVTQDEAKAEFVPRMQKAMEFLRTNPSFEEQRAARMRRDKEMFNLDFDEQANLESIYGEPVYPGSGYSAVELLRILEEPDAHVSSLNNYYRDISGWVQEAEKAMKHYAPPEEGMARGGPVHFSDNPDVMQLELAGGGLVKGLGKKLPKLDRAPAKSVAEINAIAERLAPQVTGEYVRKDAKSAKTVAGKTQKQFQREKTLPVDVRPTGEERIPELVDIEKLKGDVMIGVPGDPTLTGKTLYSVGDFTLGSPSPQHGGPLYGLYSDDAFWASGIGPARGVQNLAKRASKQYDAPVKANYIMMGPDSINYAQHFADANLQAIDLSRMTKAQVDQFNELIRRGSPKSGPRVSFPGIEDKDSAYLQMAMDPELRKHFNALMQMPTVTETLNLPSGTDIRFAITEPSLRDLETGVTGYSMGKMRPDIASKELPLSTHPTYDYDIPGEFMGQSRYPMPYELSFPDTLQSIRANPKQARQEFGSLKMVGPRQTIDQQMIDEIKMYEERMKRLTGKKAGGAVRKADGGEITADDLILEERKL
jgi:hypothetical protein